MHIFLKISGNNIMIALLITSRNMQFWEVDFSEDQGYFCLPVREHVPFYCSIVHYKWYSVVCTDNNFYGITDVTI